MEILDVRWFCGPTNVGVVMVRLHKDAESVHYFIGACSGDDQEVDKKFIAEWGVPFPDHVGDMLFSNYRIELAQLYNSNVMMPTNDSEARAMVNLGLFYLERVHEDTGS